MVNKVNVKKSRSKLVIIIAAAVLLIAAGVLGIAAAAIPARRASRITVLDAIAET